MGITSEKSEIGHSPEDDVLRSCRLKGGAESYKRMSRATGQTPYSAPFKAFTALSTNEKGLRV